MRLNLYFLFFKDFIILKNHMSQNIKINNLTFPHKIQNLSEYLRLKLL